MIILYTLLHFSGLYLLYCAAERTHPAMNKLVSLCKSNRTAARIAGTVFLLMSLGLIIKSYGFSTGIFFGTLLFMLVTSLMVALLPVLTTKK
jgi:hypothetical protein